MESRPIDRSEWLNQMRIQAEALYDHLASAYWVTFGFYPNATHCRFVDKLLARLAPHSALLDAGCGAGRYDGQLLEAGHRVLGIDQSAQMLARAREHYPPDRFPDLRYQKVALQDMEFQAEFDGAICVDAMEHISPEDWPGILLRFRRALRRGGLLYFTVEVADWGEVQEAYERARALGLPVVFGEVVNRVDATGAEIAALDSQAVSGEQADPAVYHYYPSLDRVRAWLDRAGLVVEEEGTGDGYAHLLARKTA